MEYAAHNVTVSSDTTAELGKTHVFTKVKDS